MLSSERAFEPFCDVWEVTHFEAEGLVPETSLFPNGFAFDVAHSSLSSVRELTIVDAPSAQRQPGDPEAGLRTSAVAPLTGYITTRSVIDQAGNGTSWLCNAQPLSPPALSSSPANYLFPSVFIEPYGVEETVVKFYGIIYAPFPNDKPQFEITKENISYLHTHVKNLEI